MLHTAIGLVILGISIVMAVAAWIIGGLFFVASYIAFVVSAGIRRFLRSVSSAIWRTI